MKTEKEKIEIEIKKLTEKRDNMKKQTAVEWFYEQITKSYWDYPKYEYLHSLFEQSLVMEREQIKKAFRDAENFPDDYFDPTTPDVGCDENYYVETYKK